MNLVCIVLIGDFVETKEPQLVFIIIVVQVVLNRDDSSYRLIAVVIAYENFPRRRFIKRIGVNVQHLTLHRFERMHNGRVVAIDRASQSVKVSPMFASGYCNRSHCQIVTNRPRR